MYKYTIIILVLLSLIFSGAFAVAQDSDEKIIVDQILFSPAFKSDKIYFITDSGKIRNDLINQYPKASDHAPVEAKFNISEN